MTLGMKLCPYCGEEIREDSNFCPYCGEKQNDESPMVQQPPAEPNSYPYNHQSAPQPYPYNNQPEHSYPNEQAPVPSNNRKFLKWGLFGLLALAIIAALAFFVPKLFGSDGEDEQREAALTVDSDSIEAENFGVAVEEAPPAEPGRGDLGVFDLRGPVKTCKMGKRTLSFNEEGRWMAENGKSLKKIYSGGVKRDKNGRISKGMFDPYDETGHDYTLNKQGLVVEINFRDYMDSGTTVTYTYDADGYVATMTTQEWGIDAFDEETGEGPKPDISKYTIVEKDQVGNWVKRKDQRGRLETRTIIYY